MKLCPWFRIIQRVEGQPIKTYRVYRSKISHYCSKCKYFPLFLYKFVEVCMGEMSLDILILLVSYQRYSLMSITLLFWYYDKHLKKVYPDLSQSDRYRPILPCSGMFGAYYRGVGCPILWIMVNLLWYLQHHTRCTCKMVFNSLSVRLAYVCHMPQPYFLITLKLIPQLYYLSLSWLPKPE